MNTRQLVCRAAVCVSMLAAVGINGAWAQSAQVRSRVVEAVNDLQTTVLKGNVHPLARPEFDQGALPESQPMTRMYLVLQRSQEQEGALTQLLEDQQNKNSANFHAWLTPDQFGKQFGPSDADVQAVTDWLTRQGFQVGKISAGRTVIEFSGNVAQAQNAFHTQIHRFAVNGKERFANVSDPSIPQALSPVVRGVMGLHSFRKKPYVHLVGNFRRDSSTGETKPLLTFTDVNGTFYGVGPADFAKIYDISGFDGTGTSIAVVARSNILITDVESFQTMFGMTKKDPQIILNGADPGLVSGDETESDLDVEWAGAVAPGANIILVASESTQTDGVDGVDASGLYIVDNNVAPILSDSYGSCESAMGASGNAYYQSLWQQAAAEGITVVVAAGDNGPAGCDDPSTETAATMGLAISGLASTPYNVAMGGTDFNQINNWSTYWSPNGDSNTNNVYPSALSYIPEMTWNDSCAGQSGGVSACASATATTGLTLAAGSGGPSTCGVWNTAGTTCSGYPKPTWQQNVTLSDTVRDIPDVSLFASDGGFGGTVKSFYVICESDQNITGDANCNLTNRSNNVPYHDFQAVGGTSAATPTFAGIVALVNQKTGQRQGNINYVLYNLANGSNKSSVFHDVTTGNISVPCAGNSPNCSATSTSATGVMTTTSGGTTIAYTAGTGYDLATGWGSVDVGQLLTNWASPSFSGSSTTLSSVSPTNLTVDASVSVSGSVARTSGSGTPTGFVVLENVTTGAAIDTFTLNSSGSFSGTTAFLPGGSYSVKAHYGGDGTFGASDSNAIAVTVGKQNSTVVVTWEGPNGTPVNSPVTAQYGSSYMVRIDVENAGGTPCQNQTNGTVGFVCPTGAVSLFQNSGVPLNDFPNTNGTGGANNVANLNDRGFTEDQPIQLPVGSYNISATYAGDNSYNAQSTSNTIKVSITQASTTTTVATSPTTTTPGANVTLTATVNTQSSGVGPTGSVSFTSNGTSVGSATCTPTAANLTTSVPAFCTAQLTVAISSLYPLPKDGPRTPSLPRVPMILALVSLLLFVLGMRWVPQARRRAYAYAGLLAIALLVGVVAGCGGGGGGGGGGGTRTIGASYAGDTNYAGSSGSTQIIVQ